MHLLAAGDLEGRTVHGVHTSVGVLATARTLAGDSHEAVVTALPLDLLAVLELSIPRELVRTDLEASVEVLATHARHVRAGDLANDEAGTSGLLDDEVGRELNLVTDGHLVGASLDVDELSLTTVHNGALVELLAEEDGVQVSSNDELLELLDTLDVTEERARRSEETAREQAAQVTARIDYTELEDSLLEGLDCLGATHHTFIQNNTHTISSQ